MRLRRHSFASSAATLAMVAEAALLMVVPASCGGGGSGSAGGSGSTGQVATPTNVQAFATDFCNLFTTCCMKAGLRPSDQTCQAFVLALSAGQTYSPSAGQSCIQQTQQQSSQPGFCEMLSSGMACRDVFSGGPGGAGPGQPCAKDGDCTKLPGGTSTCWIETKFVDGGTTSSGSCVQLAYGMANQGPCLGTVSGNSTGFGWSGSTPPPGMAYLCNVADGVSCNGSTHMCSPLAATGQPCTQGVQCVAADYCAFATSGSTCAPRIADGASCASAPSSACLTTSYCDPGSQTCKPLLAGGSACSLDQQCQSHRCTNATCGFASGLSLYCAP